MNIYQRMNAVAEDIKRIPKNLTVGFGKSQYQAVAEADVLAAVKEAEHRHGITSYPASRRIVESRTIKRSDDKESQFVRFETTYRFVNIDEPTEIVEVVSYGDGIDSQDKAPGKAMTYADKYALMKAYKIETGDDVADTVKDGPEGHDALMVKRRMEEKATLLNQKGIDLTDVLADVGPKGSNIKQFSQCMGYLPYAVSVERAMDKWLGL